MPAVSESRYLVQATWDDVPHLDEKTKAELLGAMKPHQRDARTKGIPALGSGAIYPVAESEITCAPFQIPVHWPKAYGMDVGWNRTAALWAAHDRSSDTVYLYSEYYKGESVPSVHATAIKARGLWVPGVIDPASRGRMQDDGEQLLYQYLSLGLNLQTAVNAREAGIDMVLERLSTGRLKVFTTLQNFLAEYRIYRRDDKGKIVKKFDHLMDCLRYLIVSGLAVAITEPMNQRGRSIVGSASHGDTTVGY